MNNQIDSVTFELKIKQPIKYISPTNVIKKGDRDKFDWQNDAFLKPNTEGAKKIIEKFRDVRVQRKSGLIDVARYVKENLDRNLNNERVLAPLAANLELFVEQNLNRYIDNKSAINLAEITTQSQKIDITLVPLNKEEKIDGVQIKDINGNKRLFRPIRPSQINSKYRRKLVQSIRDQARILPHDAVIDANNIPQWETWQHKIEDPSNDEILWIPINPDDPEQILINEHTLQTYLKVECFKDLSQEEVNHIAHKYQNIEILWNSEKSHSNETDNHILETDIFTSSSSNSDALLVSQITEEILLETGYLDYDKKKSLNQDCAYVGRNQDGMQAIAIYDAVSKSTRGHVLSRIMAAHVGVSSGKDKNSLLKALKMGFEAAQIELENVDGNAAATGTAGLIDKDNMLHLAHKGDTRAYLIRNGELKLLTPIQNEKTMKIRELMKKDPNMTKSEAKKIIEDRFPNIRNTPNVYNIDEDIKKGGIVEITAQLQPGDQLIFSSDGAFDNMQTLAAEEAYILKAAQQKNPAQYLGDAANALRKQQGKKYRDDLGIAYLRIK